MTQLNSPSYMQTNAEFDWSSSYVGFGFGQVTGLVINPKLVNKPDISSPSS